MNRNVLANGRDCFEKDNRGSKLAGNADFTVSGSKESSK